MILSSSVATTAPLHPLINLSLRPAACGVMHDTYCKTDSTGGPPEVFEENRAGMFAWWSYVETDGDVRNHTNMFCYLIISPQ